MEIQALTTKQLALREGVTPGAIRKRRHDERKRKARLAAARADEDQRVEDRATELAADAMAHAESAQRRARTAVLRREADASTIAGLRADLKASRKAEKAALRKAGVAKAREEKAKGVTLELKAQIWDLRHRLGRSIRREAESEATISELVMTVDAGDEDATIRRVKARLRRRDQQIMDLRKVSRWHQIAMSLAKAVGEMHPPSAWMRLRSGDEVSVTYSGRTPGRDGETIDAVDRQSMMHVSDDVLDIVRDALGAYEDAEESGVDDLAKAFSAAMHNAMYP